MKTNPNEFRDSLPPEEVMLEPSGQFAADLRNLRSAVQRTAERSSSRPLSSAWLISAKRRQRAAQRRVMLVWGLVGTCAALLCLGTLPLLHRTVPVVEQRTCYKTVWKSVPVTETRKVMVDRGHYECQMVEAKPSILERLCHKKNDCCEPCPKMVAKKVWVPCMVCEERCVTTCKRVCEQVPYTTCVTTCKIETRTETCPVTRVRCVPLLGRNRSFLFNCDLDIVQILQDCLFDHALEQKHGERL